MSGEGSLLAQRLRSQLLAGAPASDAVAVTDRLLAIQAQDPRGARLAIRARSVGLSAADVDRALTADRSLVISSLNRGTLHLVRSEDYPWLHALTTPPLATPSARRLAQEGVSPSAAERALAVIERSLAREGPLTRMQLRDRIAAAGVRTQGQALVHILFLATLRGLIVRGPMVGAHDAYALVRDWLGAPPRFDRGAALAELARRYLAGHGPADARDLANWAGLPLRDARAGLAAVAAEVETRPDGTVGLARAPGDAGLPAPRLLGPFDPVLLGWKSRAPVLGAHERTVVSGGLIRAFALVRGQAAATWGLRAGEVVLEPFARLSRAHAAALAAEAKDVTRFLGSRSRA